MDLARRPVLGLVYMWQAKLPVSISGAAILSVVEVIMGHYGRLLHADPVLVLLVVALMAIDWITGIVASVRRGESIKSLKMRYTGWKILEYAGLGLVATMFANGFSHTVFSPITNIFDDAALFYMASTEIVSVIENVAGGKEAARRILGRIMSFVRSPSEAAVESVRNDDQPAP